MITGWGRHLLQVTGWGKQPAPPQTPLWIAWADLLGRFPLSWYLVSHLQPGRHRWAAIDDVGRMRAKPRVAQAVVALANLEPAVVEQLAALTRANLDRHVYFSRLILLAYFTVPLTVGAVLAQLAPVWLNHIIADYAPTIAGGFAGAALAVVVRLTAEARARQLVTILDFALIERGLAVPK